MTTQKKDHAPDEKKQAEPHEKSQEKKFRMPLSLKNPRALLVGIVALLLVAGGAAWYFRDALPPAVTDLFMQGEAVATVNGKRISKTEFDRRVAVAEAQGQPVSDEMRKQLVDQMVNEEVVFQEAEAQGLTSTQEAVDAQYAQIVESFPSEQEFQDALMQEQLTEQELKQNVGRQLVLNQYFEKMQKDNPAEVTTEEIQAFYDQSVASMEDAPPLEEVQGQIEQQLQQQKFNEVAMAHIEALRAKADIKILI